MAGRFASASSQYVKNASSPLVSTGYPFTMAVWVNLTTLQGQTIACLAASGVDTQNLRIESGATGTFSVTAQVSAGSTLATTTGVAATGEWTFVVGRFISATNRWIDVLFAKGAPEHVQATTSRAPTSLDTIGIGGRISLTPALFLSGLVGEFWYTDTDIQPDGLALNDVTLRQLAYGGPFSMANIVKDIVEYRSLLKALTSNGDDPAEVYSRGVPRVWTQSGVPTVGPHCPLPYSYKKPRERKRLLLV
jgi:hypothetical protein